MAFFKNIVTHNINCNLNCDICKHINENYNYNYNDNERCNNNDQDPNTAITIDGMITVTIMINCNNYSQISLIFLISLISLSYYDTVTCIHICKNRNCAIIVLSSGSLSLVRNYHCHFLNDKVIIITIIAVSLSFHWHLYFHCYHRRRWNNTCLYLSTIGILTYITI